MQSSFNTFFDQYQAFLEEIDTRKLKHHANWSQRSDTFERYYFKPKEQHIEGTRIAKAMFQQTTFAKW
ncbi:hypothetical protein BCV72DRAFT_226894 [Rhizopus microsporus var. microsporus]|uniref:Uncharacterized protein n=2 Tax=Rhizopus microsporus TaxID=58291 RepID=A0A2G4SX13_RHIZD|nr:uncharacterized protein RHIMIDRAFT_279029 [Rhizopus microsporus ATCC 52813]ORE07309.1 hypothetical protein BCV72DRAFT_226894 [Rhizopus microsporus var. microsporus]PHZ13323.1 hypothetical protein RHIMIDRAFT_279029 [Rhizopus microsporus ATCC 52813]